MAFLSRLNPVPQFPSYKGSYNVASFELEIPVAALSESAQKPPPSAASISTVQFRVFYPTSPREHVSASEQSAAGSMRAEDHNEEMEKEAEAGGGKPHWASSWFQRHARPKTPEPQKSVYWLPEPHQREYLSGYARFLGAGSGLAELISHVIRLYIPRVLHHIALPAVASAPLIPTATDFKFPTMIFSHGLGGTRLAYSHICGSLASNGIVVIAPEHRDGSCPVTFVKNPAQDTAPAKVEGSEPESGEPGIDASSAAAAQTKPGERVQVDYTPYDHQINEETANGRDRQLEIRLWEMSMVYSAVTKLDTGKLPASTAMFDADTATRDSLLSQFTNKLDIRTPGRLIWAGHSFGASTTIQLLKSVYYASSLPEPTPTTQPLFIPDPTTGDDTDSIPLGAQITATSPALLLDIWCLPTLSQRTHALFKLPLPQIGAGNPRRVLCIMSDEFFRWRENLRCAKRLLTPDPGRRRGTEEHKNFELWDTDATESAHSKFHPHNDVQTPATSGPPGGGQLGDQIIPPAPTASPAPDAPAGHAPDSEPRMFYIKDSAHLSQSDFGILFPRAVRKAVGHEEILDMNVRAACQWLRECGFAGQVAPWKSETGGSVLDALKKMEIGGEEQDREIFEGQVERWVRIAVEE
ncbi:platelet-activating factor acetylhydrolase, isoform II-domain-containing protein [Geopyxis carbonaria]|nr:platelet-activating factor acetylhydrolase, isoform II-domain-containing protein [Geopyxis carbonaria]